MNPELIGKLVANIGIPGAILIYLIWRLDKFLTFLTEKLTTYNREFSDINGSINLVAQKIDNLAKLFTQHPKK
jgi:hypothetical protein